MAACKHHNDPIQCCACAIDRASVREYKGSEDDREAIMAEGRRIWQKAKAEKRIYELLDGGYTVSMLKYIFKFTHSQEEIKQLRSLWRERNEYYKKYPWER